MIIIIAFLLFLTFFTKSSELIYDQDHKGNTSLHTACKHGQFREIKTIIKKFPNLTLILNNNNKFPLELIPNPKSKAFKKLLRKIMPCLRNNLSPDQIYKLLGININNIEIIAILLQNKIPIQFSAFDDQTKQLIKDYINILRDIFNINLLYFDIIKEIISNNISNNNLELLTYAQTKFADLKLPFFSLFYSEEEFNQILSKLLINISEEKREDTLNIIKLLKKEFPKKVTIIIN